MQGEELASIWDGLNGEIQTKRYNRERENQKAFIHFSLFSFCSVYSSLTSHEYIDGVRYERHKIHSTRKKVITMQTQCVLYHIVKHNNNIHTASLALTIPLFYCNDFFFLLTCDTQTEYRNMLRTN